MILTEMFAHLSARCPVGQTPVPHSSRRRGNTDGDACLPLSWCSCTFNKEVPVLDFTSESQDGYGKKSDFQAQFLIEWRFRRSAVGGTLTSVFLSSISRQFRGMVCKLQKY